MVFGVVVPSPSCPSYKTFTTTQAHGKSSIDTFRTGPTYRVVSKAAHSTCCCHKDAGVGYICRDLRNARHRIRVWWRSHYACDSVPQLAKIIGAPTSHATASHQCANVRVSCTERRNASEHHGPWCSHRLSCCSNAGLTIGIRTKALHIPSCCQQAGEKGTLLKREHQVQPVLMRNDTHKRTHR